MFYDLNIPASNLAIDDSVEETITRAVKYGYRGMAITINLDEDIFEKLKREKEKRKGPSSTDVDNCIPAPPDLTKLKSIHRNIHFYTRINFKLSQVANIRKLFQCKELKKYDLISLEPENQDVLKSLPAISGFDILSYNPENKYDLNFNRKLYNQFVNQNLYFELVYGPGIVDSTARRNLIIISHVYKSVGKSKNIIVSSRAQFPHQIRGPHDVLNFNLLFGLSEQQSKTSLTLNCKKLLLRAGGRTSGKAVIQITRNQNKVPKKPKNTLAPLKPITLNPKLETS